MTVGQLTHQLSVRPTWVKQRIPGIADDIVTDLQLQALARQLKFNRGFTWLPVDLYDTKCRFVAPPEAWIIGLSSPIFSQLRRMSCLPYIALPTATGKKTVPRYPTSYLTALRTCLKGADPGTKLKAAQAYAQQCRESGRIM